MRKLEADLQTGCVKWFRYQYAKYGKLLFAVPNGGSRNHIEAANLKRQGVTAGVSDLILLIPMNGYHGLLIELKIGKNKQSEHQQVFQLEAEGQGYKYIVVRDLIEFINQINIYLQ